MKTSLIKTRILDCNVFGVHAGLSPSLELIKQIDGFERKMEVPHEGGMCDLLWSDPEEDFTGWGVSQRGAGYVFGGDVVQQFNHCNNLNMICRSHQLIMQGHKEIFNGGLVTVWSAPNYCYRCGNNGSILNFDGPNKVYTVYSAAPSSERQNPRISKQIGHRVAPDYFL